MMIATPTTSVQIAMCTKRKTLARRIARFHSFNGPNIYPIDADARQVTPTKALINPEIIPVAVAVSNNKDG